MCIELFRRSREQGFKCAPKPYCAVENEEKRMLVSTLYTMRNEVITQNLKRLFWFIGGLVIFAL